MLLEILKSLTFVPSFGSETFIAFFDLIGFGIIFSDYLDQIKFGGFKLGFWFAQQGSIYIFVILVFLYVWLMKRLDKKFSEEEDS